MAIDTLIPLEQARYNVPHLSEGKLLSNADARAAVEGDICPWLRLPDIPTFGGEDFRVGEGLAGRRVQFWTALHGKCTVANWCIFEDREWLASIGATTPWEGGIFKCQSNAVDGVPQISMGKVKRSGDWLG